MSPMGEEHFLVGRQIDRHEEANRRFVQFRENA